MPKGNPTGQTKATEKYRQKMGIIAKNFKLPLNDAPFLEGRSREKTAPKRTATIPTGKRQKRSAIM